MMACFPGVLSIILILMFASWPVWSYFPDWGMQGGRPTQPTCVDIPKNMSLCHEIGYNKMRLPNLLDHDTMAEVSQQAASWIPLLNVRCHPDTQLFLCSLFSPVCLDRPIYPCRSLCEKVKAGCEGRMKNYGFPWPDMLKCDKFPLDNDMCITAQSGAGGTNDGCKACNQVTTYENILDNFCRADFAVRTKIRKTKKSKLICKKSKIYKSTAREKSELRAMRRPIFLLDSSDHCCEEKTKNNKNIYLIMGQKRGENLVPTFIMPWARKSRPFKKAVRMFKHLNCTDPKLVSRSVIADTFGTGSVKGSEKRRGRRRSRRKHRKNKYERRNKKKTEETLQSKST